MSAQHTPGPWHVGRGDVYAKGNASSDFDDIVVCAIGRGGGSRSHEYAIVKAHKPEGKANARLIAAAPELLEALEAVAPYLNAVFNGEDETQLEPTSGQLFAMNRAIAKAKGGDA